MNCDEIGFAFFAQNGCFKDGKKKWLHEMKLNVRFKAIDLNLLKPWLVSPISWYVKSHFGVLSRTSGKLRMILNVLDCKRHSFWTFLGLTGIFDPTISADHALLGLRVYYEHSSMKKAHKCRESTLWAVFTISNR